jgi:Arc/MetJ-type ribon-helix-helix transcriptional regulator
MYYTINFNYMRNIVNISLPNNLLQVVKKEVKTSGYASTSEFFRHLIRLWNTKQLGQELKIDRKKFEQGQGKKIKSLADLD